MAAQQFNLLIEQGANYTLSIPVLDGSGQPQDVTGWTATGQIRAGYYDTTILHQLALSLAGSTVTLGIPAATSAAWNWRTGRYDVELVDPGGVVSRLVAGVVAIRPEITRPSS